jgi:transcriptional regulator with XRE-family HTH domain/tetratricopeptide (TPR) repeat protein
VPSIVRTEPLDTASPSSEPVCSVPPPAREPAGHGGRGLISPLRELRLRRYWTQADFSARFEERSRQIGRPLSLSVRQVRRWESENPPLPLPAYQAVLEALLGVPIEQLGFQPVWEQEFGRRGATAGGAGINRSSSDDLEGYDPVRRREFVAGAAALGTTVLATTGPGAVLGTTVLGAAGAGTEVDTSAARFGPAEADEHGPRTGFALITAQHRTMYWSVPAAAMFAPVAAHSELGLGLLRSAKSSGERAGLALPVAETALLAARMAFFDLLRPEVAQDFFDTALDAAVESGDRAMQSAVLTHMAFVPAFAGIAAPARALMARAHRVADHAVGSTQQSWMLAVEAEVETKLGNPDHAASLISRSETALHGEPDEVPQWLDFFDEARLDSFKGFCHLSTGRPQLAARALEQTLRNLPGTAVKQRSIALADLAQARVQQGELEESVRLLGGAISSLQENWYGTGVERVDGVRRSLAAHNAPSRSLAPLTESRHSLEGARP